MRFPFWRHMVVCSSLLALSFPVLSSGQEIAATIEWNPKPAQAPSSVTPLVRDDDGNALTAQQRGDTWTFAVPPRDTIFEALEVSLSGAIPTEYDFGKLRLEVPYYSERAVAAVLAPIRTDSGAEEVRALFARQTHALSDTNVQIRFQEARSIAFARMNSLQGWNSLHDYHVQAVYKFLEISVALTRKTTFVPMTDDLDKAFEWLFDAIAINEGRVTHAMGGNLDLAKRVLNDISAVRGNRLADLWRRILKEPNDDRHCTLLESYYQYLLEMPEDDYRQAVRITGVPDTHILSAQAICVVRAAKSGNPVEAISPRALAERMEGLLDHTDGDNLAMLQSDIAVLREFF